ncbi:energy transducer TonB [Pseudoxanthomonas daejeonensis]
MLLALASGAAPAEDMAAATAGACPFPAYVEPVYPESMRQQELGGEVLLDLSVDTCGRVTQARVKRGSGHPSLDEAALVAARRWVLNPADRARAAGGRIEVPLAFGMERPKIYAYGPHGWPKSHKRVRYVQDVLPGYESPQQVLDRYPLDPASMITPPYPSLRSMFFRQRSDPDEYWLFVYLQGEPRMATRYRLGSVGDEPVVRVAYLCDATPATCEQDRKMIMRGLPFARAR